MNKLIILAIATLALAGAFWLASPPDAPNDQSVSVDDNAEIDTSGASSAEELIARYVDSYSQKDSKAFIALLHPESLANVENKELGFSNWGQLITNHSFKVAPISKDKLDALTNAWMLPLNPSHVIALKFDHADGGRMGYDVFAIESNGKWHVIQPTMRNPNPKTPDPTIDSFIYEFDPDAFQNFNHQWTLSFSTENQNDFQVLLVSDEEQILLSTRQLNKDQHGRKNLRVVLQAENIESAESMFRIPCSIGSASGGISADFKIPGNQALNFAPVSQPTRSGHEIVLGEFSVMNDGKLEAHRLLVREHDPLSPVPREVFLDL